MAKSIDVVLIVINKIFYKSRTKKSLQKKNSKLLYNFHTGKELKANFT